tara:strand:- start:1064 stop:1450 length:387 start_codon:yes stop_codon:yes gene_type:complete
MEEEFYASVKLISGEELFGIVNTVEKDGKYILICNPVIVTPMFSQKREMNGYKVEPWLKTSSDDMFLLSMEKVITLSESENEQIITIYQTFLQDLNDERGQLRLSDKMGYVGNINETKKLLEKLYRKS